MAEQSTLLVPHNQFMLSCKAWFVAPGFGTHHWLPPLPPVDGAAGVADEPGDECVVGWVGFGTDDPPPV